MKRFCSKSSYSDDELFEQFIENDSYIILMSLKRNINEYANQIECLKKVIDVLTEWKKTESFYTAKTTFYIRWDDCYDADKTIEVLNLKDAKKMYSEAELKYNTLLELFYKSSKIHYKDKDKEYLIDKYFK